jgi:hypothetical protein
LLDNLIIDNLFSFFAYPSENRSFHHQGLPNISYQENLMLVRTCCAIVTGLLIHAAVVWSADMTNAYIINEDSHPHQVAPGEAARFSVEATRTVAHMDVKCSLEGDGGMPLTGVTLRTQGLTDVEWPFSTRTIRLDQIVILTSQH